MGLRILGAFYNFLKQDECSTVMGGFGSPRLDSVLLLHVSHHPEPNLDAMSGTSSVAVVSADGVAMFTAY